MIVIFQNYNISDQVGKKEVTRSHTPCGLSIKEPCSKYIQKIAQTLC